MKRKIERLKAIIQRNHDDFNWYGYNQKKQQQSESAQKELIQLTGSKFIPQYNCPA
jgi:hypothetical protein